MLLVWGLLHKWEEIWKRVVVAFLRSISICAWRDKRSEFAKRATGQML